MKLLVVCEESDTVRSAFERRGWDAWSVDLQPSRNPNAQHYQGDLFDILGCGWDLVISHLPCTAIAVSGNRYYAGTQARLDAIAFAERFWFSPMYQGPLGFENPVGVLTTQSRIPVKPQYIQPYDFGEDASKKTGLWLRDLPPLKNTGYFPPRMVCVCGQVYAYEEEFEFGCPHCGAGDALPRWSNQTNSGQNKLPPSEARAKERATTYPKIAEAMATQWTEYMERK